MKQVWKVMAGYENKTILIALYSTMPRAMDGVERICGKGGKWEMINTLQVYSNTSEEGLTYFIEPESVEE